MEAVVWHGRGDVRLDTVGEPASPTAGSTLISVTRCGLCGSDRREYLTGPFMIPRSPHPLTRHSGPVILGHEIVGRVVEVGKGAGAGETVQRGTRVAIDPLIKCGTCAACSRGDTHLCTVAGCVGISSHGGLAPFAVVPTSGLVTIPDHVTDDDAGLAEPLSVALHALDRGQLQPGESVVVSGFGPIGAGVVALSRSMGASSIVVIEPSAARRELATRLGATAVIDPGPADSPSADLTDIRGLADVGFDCSGGPGSIDAVIRSTRAGARIVVPAVSSGSSPIHMSQIVLRERSIIGTVGNRGDVGRVIALLAEGRLSLSGFVYAVIPLAGAVGWIEDPGTFAGGLKVLVDPIS